MLITRGDGMKITRKKRLEIVSALKEGPLVSSSKHSLV